MKKRWILMVLGLALSLGRVGPAWAWNGAGHRLIAHLAWAQLSPETRQAAGNLLHQHPDYEHWVALAPQGGDTRMWVFAEASTWADDIRRDPRFGPDEDLPRLPGFPDMERHAHWHYAEAGEGDRDEHVYVAMTRLYALLRDPRQSAATRAYALVWLLHLVGDAHQPLHNGFRNDRGGNEVPVMVFDAFANRSTNLHAFWDDLAGKSSQRGTTLLHMADALLGSEKRVLRETRPDFERWRQDNFRISRQFAYPPGDYSQADGFREPRILSSTFMRRSQQVASQQWMLAGQRLALVLETALGGERRTPFHVERHPG